MIRSADLRPGSLNRAHQLIALDVASAAAFGDLSQLLDVYVEQIIARRLLARLRSSLLATMNGVCQPRLLIGTTARNAAVACDARSAADPDAPGPLDTDGVES